MRRPTRPSRLLPLLLAFLVPAAGAADDADAGPRLGPVLSRLLRGPGVRPRNGPAARPVEAAELRALGRRVALDAESEPPRVRVWMRLDPSARTAARALGGGVALQAEVGDLVSAIVPLPRLAALAAIPGLEWMQIPRRPRPELDVSVPEIGGDVSVAAHDLRGRNVSVGFVDSGLDFTHEDFLDAAGNTRIAFLWDQTVDCGNPPAPFTYGCLYTRSDIDAALDGMGAVTFPNSDGHGTHVAGIAAGDGSATGNGQPSETYVGMADRATIIAVKVFPEPGDDCPMCDVGDALCFIDQKSALAGRPWVANLSLGFDDGGHDGSDPIEQVIDTLTGPGIPGKVVVKSAGNNRGFGIHVSGTVSTGTFNDHSFTVPAYIASAGLFNDRQLWQMWYDADDDMSVRITSPGGHQYSTFTGDCACFDTLLPCTLDAQCPGSFCHDLFGLDTPDGTLAIGQTCTPTANGSRAFDLLVDDQLGTPPAVGTFTFRVTGNAVSGGGEYDAWIIFSSFGDDGLFSDWSSPDFSAVLTMPGTAFHVTTVAAYTTRHSWTSIDNSGFLLDPLPTLGELGDFSSPGPTRDGRTKPELAAPGQIVGSALSADAAPDVLAGTSRNFVLQDGVHWLLQGTSMSAPHVAGLYARMLELDPGLDAVQLRTLLTGSARDDAFTGAVPNDDWGFGKVDAIGAIDNQIKPLDDVAADGGGTFSFTDSPYADTYHVFRVDLETLDGTDYGTCLFEGLASPAFSDPAVPASGTAFGYTVAGERDGVPGLIGFTSGGDIRPRPECI